MSLAGYLCENERMARLKECLRRWQQGSKDSTNIIKCKCREFMPMIPSRTSQFSNTPKPFYPAYGCSRPDQLHARSSAIFAACSSEIKISDLDARIFYMEQRPQIRLTLSVDSAHRSNKLSSGSNRSPRATTPKLIRKGHLSNGRKRPNFIHSILSVPIRQTFHSGRCSRKWKSPPIERIFRTRTLTMQL